MDMYGETKLEKAKPRLEHHRAVTAHMAQSEGVGPVW